MATKSPKREKAATPSAKGKLVRKPLRSKQGQPRRRKMRLSRAKTVAGSVASRILKVDAADTGMPGERLASLVQGIARESGAVKTGQLMVQVFESMVVSAASKPIPRAGLPLAELRGRVAREELKQEEGGSISAAEAADRLGISKTAVLKRYHAGQLLGWKEARQGALRFPVWQFKEENMLPGVTETLQMLNQASWMDDWARILFFLNRRASLEGQRPLDLLRKGEKKQALQAATDAIQ